MTAPTTGKRPDVEELLGRLGPQLDELEQFRQSLRHRALRSAGVMAAVAVVLAIVLWLIIGPGTPNAGLAVLPLIVGGGLAIYLLARGQKQWREQAQARLVPEVCNAIDEALEYQSVVTVDNFLAPFEALRLVGDSNRQHLQHYFRGRHLGWRFEMVDARLQSRSGGRNTSSLPVFTGFLIRIEWPRRVDPGITLSPNFGWFMNTFGKSSVKTGDEAFDEKFLVSPEKGAGCTSESIRNVLPEALRRAFLDINEAEGRLAHDRAAFHAGLKHDSLYIALTRYQQGSSIGPVKFERPQPFLDVGLYLSPRSGLKSGVGAMVDDIHVVYRVIDRLDPALR